MPGLQESFKGLSSLEVIMLFMNSQNKCYQNEYLSEIQLFISSFAYNDITFLFNILIKICMK